MDDQGTNRDRGGSVTSPEFSLKRLVVSISLAALGLFIVSLSRPFEVRKRAWPLNEGLALCWLIGGTLIGAGLMTPCNRIAVGAKYGGLVQLALLACAVFMVGLLEFFLSFYPTMM